MERIGLPTENDDAINRQYLNDNALCKTGNVFDGKKLIVSNIAEPRNADDAVSKRYLKSALSELAYAVYSNVHKGRDSLLSSAEWDNQVNRSVSWKELFNSI